MPTPSPGKYSLPRAFETRKKSEGVSMGLGRDYVKYRNMFNENLKKAPEPASYRPIPVQNNRSYSIAHRI